MAREFAKIYMTIWGDPDFVSLDVSAQRLYLFLCSQADLSRAGTITIAPNRWASRADGYDRATLWQDMGTLARYGYIVVDEHSEELLVRSYIRNDEGWKSPNIMIAIAGAARNVMSETLRAVIRDELRKIDTTSLPTKINPNTNRSTRDAIEHFLGRILADLSDCEADPYVMGYGKGSVEPFAEGFTEGFEEGSLTTTTTATTTATATGKSAPNGAGYPEDFATFWNVYPLKRDKRSALKAFNDAKKRTPVDEIIAGAIRYRDDPNREAEYTKYPERWLKADGWDDDPLPSRKPHMSNQGSFYARELARIEAKERATTTPARLPQIGA